MRATRIPADEQFRLIMECRASGLTDHEWCLQNDIKPGTFYNWVKRLRKRGCPEIPDSAGHHPTQRQEIVKTELPPPGKDAKLGRADRAVRMSHLDTRPIVSAIFSCLDQPTYVETASSDTQLLYISSTSEI